MRSTGTLAVRRTTRRIGRSGLAGPQEAGPANDFEVQPRSSYVVSMIRCCRWRVIVGPGFCNEGFGTHARPRLYGRPGNRLLSKWQARPPQFRRNADVTTIVTSNLTRTVTQQESSSRFHVSAKPAAQIRNALCPSVHTSRQLHAAQFDAFARPDDAPDLHDASEPQS